MFTLDLLDVGTPSASPVAHAFIKSSFPFPILLCFPLACVIESIKPTEQRRMNA